MWEAQAAERPSPLSHTTHSTPSSMPKVSLQERAAIGEGYAVLAGATVMALLAAASLAPGHWYIAVGLPLVTAFGLQATSDRARQRLMADALTDPLTGLHNRRHLDRRLVEEVAQARRSGAPLSLAVLDLDDFKAINDRLGHDAGDEALRRFADALRAVIRRSDVVARAGGDEFLVIFPDTSRAGAVAVLERLQEQAPHGFSAGVAALAEEADVDALKRLADKRLYRVKRARKGRTWTSGRARD